MKRTGLLAIGILAASFGTAQAQDDAEKAAIAEIEKIGGAVRKVAASVDWQEVDFHLSGTELNDDGLQHVTKIKQLYWLHLKDTKITDAGLKHVAGLTELRRLHLERTGITDAGLAHLKGLANLEYLNLYGTKVTDAGIAHLHGLKKLKKVYFWQTGVTDEGVAALQKALPELNVNRGLAVAKKEEPKSAEGPPGKSLAKGQFVKVRLEGDGRILSLAEVEIVETSSGKILREGKATQSSVASAGDAARAIDGNKDQNYTGNSVTHTNTENNPWWQVDLGGVKDIGRIVVFNRGDCCGERLANGILEVLDASQKVVWIGKIEGTPPNGSKHEYAGK
jgi:hypothetical protein